MQINPYDTVLERTLQRIERASDRIAQNFKGVKPFAQEPVDKKEMIYRYSQMTPEMENDLRQTLGDTQFEDYKAEMEGMLAKRRKEVRP